MEEFTLFQLLVCFVSCKTEFVGKSLYLQKVTIPNKGISPRDKKEFIKLRISGTHPQ